MKLTIDTTEKTIAIDQVVNLSDLIDALEGLIPVEEWEEYNLIPLAKETSFREVTKPFDTRHDKLTTPDFFRVTCTETGQVGGYDIKNDTFYPLSNK